MQVLHVFESGGETDKEKDTAKREEREEGEEGGGGGHSSQ